MYAKLQTHTIENTHIEPTSIFTSNAYVYALYINNMEGLFTGSSCFVGLANLSFIFLVSFLEYSVALHNMTFEMV